MGTDYFVKHEQIPKKRIKAMIIMDIKIDNLYAFKNFHMNMSYPKRIVNSTIEEEYLKDRPNFRYKKVNIIMGSNATGKTTLGKVIMIFANYFTDGSYKRFTNIISDNTKEASLKIDFVTDDEMLYRFELYVSPLVGDTYREEDVRIHIYYTPIELKDNYEMVARRLDEGGCDTIPYELVDTSGWYFSYPQDSWTKKTYAFDENNTKYLAILEQVLKTLDPSIQAVVKIQEIEHSYAIKMDNCSVIIKEGQLYNEQVLSSGTKAGLDIAYIIASLVCDQHDFYYCDERFSYVNSDIERVCLSIIIDKLTERKQLFFTTHNTDILDMQLPKHSFAFLKKDTSDSDMPIKCIYAEQYLKRNTDSLKHAVENDVFGSAPDLFRLYEIAEL